MRQSAASCSHACLMNSCGRNRKRGPRSVLATLIRRTKLYRLREATPLLHRPSVSHSSVVGNSPLSVKKQGQVLQSNRCPFRRENSQQQFGGTQATSRGRRWHGRSGARSCARTFNLTAPAGVAAPPPTASWTARAASTPAASVPRPTQRQPAP